MPRVSVITPAHDAVTVIGETLDSVLAQTYTDYEVIVADDASSDGTASVADGYGAPVRCVRSATNLGPAGARNLALAEATGELVALLDADDLWRPEFLAEQVALYDREEARRPGVGIVACDAQELGPDGLLGTWSARVGADRDPTFERMLEGNHVYVSALVPRVLMVQLGGFAPECWGSEDHDLWLRVLETGHRLVINPRPLAIYRVSAGSVSASVVGMARTNVTTYDRALARDNLTARQRRIARRARRLQLAVLRAGAMRVGEGRSPSTLTATLWLCVRVAAEHPRRWPRWLTAARNARRA